MPEPVPAKAGSTRDVSPAAQACASWFRRLTRALKVCRLYKTDNAMIVQAREQAIEALERLVRENGGWSLYFTPTEAYLGDEPVIRPRVPGQGEDDLSSSGEEHIPFVFYGDGIRSIHIPATVARGELEALFDALRALGAGSVEHEDLVTLLWQANLRQIRIESVPFEQIIYVSSRATADAAPGPRENEKRYGWTPSGDEIHADLGQGVGAQGLHLDTFDDWELALESADVPEAYELLGPAIDYSRSHFIEAWRDENSRDWTADARDVFREMLRLDPSEDCRSAIAHAIVTWIGDSMRRLAIGEAQRALELLREFDPDRKSSESELTTMSADLDHGAFVDYLDQAPDEEHGRFAGLAVALGRPGLDLTFAVMSKATEPRVRAAACTALTYLCADDPQLLAPYFSDAQGDVMVSLVFTLGQIGGTAVLDLLQLASQHPEPKVRKQVVLALGGVPAAIRMPTLVASLESSDPHLIAATLQILTRERGPKLASALLKRIAKPDFDALPEDSRWAIFNALADVADDDCVPELQELLHRGGLFARRSFTRSAAARTLQRLGTERARAVLARGMRSINLAIRHACSDVVKEDA